MKLTEPKRTYTEIFTFLQQANGWLVKNAAESKLRYALRKVVKTCGKLLDDYNEKLGDLNIEHCSVDENDVIRKDDKGGLAFTKDNMRKLRAAQKKLVESSVVVEPFIIQDAPDDLTDVQREAFAGFVLPAVIEEPQLREVTK